MKGEIDFVEAVLISLFIAITVSSVMLAIYHPESSEGRWKCIGWENGTITGQYPNDIPVLQVGWTIKYFIAEDNETWFIKWKGDCIEEVWTR